MKKTTILFGAGADMLSTGLEFAQSVIGHEKSEMNAAIKEFYEELIPNDWRESYVENTIPMESLVEASVKQKYLTGDFPVLSQTAIDNEIKEQIKRPVLEQEDLIRKYTSYMGIIDGDFHTLIYPKALGKFVFWRVVDCFTRAYLCLVKDILNPPKPDKDFYLNKLRKPENTYKEMIEVLKSDSRFTGESYYKLLQDIKNKENLHIISTNYTPNCSVISGIDDKDIIHIHGRMDQFEDPYEWKVVSAKEAQANNSLPKEERKLLFPFLSIQSGVKPIVEKNQITEYSRMVDAFEKAERIIIVGYRINQDDNHVNSLIRSAIADNKKDVFILYFEDGKKGPCEDPDGEIRQRLRIKNKCSNLHVIRVNKDTSLGVFNDLLPKDIKEETDETETIMLTRPEKYLIDRCKAFYKEQGIDSEEEAINLYQTLTEDEIIEYGYDVYTYDRERFDKFARELEIIENTGSNTIREKNEKRRKLNRLQAEIMAEFDKPQSISREKEKLKSFKIFKVNDPKRNSRQKGKILYCLIPDKDWMENGGISIKKSHFIVNIRKLIEIIPNTIKNGYAIGKSVPVLVVLAVLSIIKDISKMFVVKIKSEMVFILVAAWRNCDVEESIPVDKCFKATNELLIENQQKAMDKIQFNELLDAMADLKLIEIIEDVIRLKESLFMDE